jgi:hypothetical protein
VDYDVWGEEDEKTINFPFFSKSFAAQNERSAGQNEELKKREKNDVWPRASFFCKREERGESSRRQKRETDRFF